MSFISNFKISTRLSVSFTVVLVLLIIISVLAVTNLKRASEFSAKVVNQDVAQGMLSSTVQHLAQSSSISLLLILNNENREERVKLYKEMDANNLKLDAILNDLAMRDGQMVNQQLAEIVSLRKKYKEEFLKTVDFVEWDPESAIKQFNQNTRPALLALLTSIQSYLTDQNKNTIVHFNEVQESSNQSIIVMEVLSVIAVILGLVLAILVSRSIVKPIRTAVRVATQMSKGDLRFDEEISGRDEVSQLLQSFSLMSCELSGLISSICNSAMEVRGSSDQLENSVEQMAEVAGIQLNAVQSIAGTVGHFSAQSLKASQTTSSAKEQAEQAQTLASKGQHLIEKATTEFDVISGSIKSSADAVETLRERSVSVRALVTTVREIAEQTNLLALNAAIEAARAGETGRGFSVVADEVRNLASRTGSATEEINKVIDAMDNETEISVQRISNGREELEAGVLLIREMVQPLSDLNEGAKASVAQLNELEQAVAEQASDSEGIDNEVQKIREMTETNQASISEISAATEALGGLSQKLEGNVSTFKLGDVAHAGMKS